MSIDFFTLIAQVINLIILLFLLRKFLYIPVLKAVEERQKLITSELKDAEESRMKAAELEKKCQQKLIDIENQKQAILLQTQNEAQELSNKLIGEAKEQFEKAKNQWKQKLVTEQKSFDLAVQNLVVEHFRIFANDALSQMADVSLNDLIVEKLQEKIKGLTVKKKKEFALAYQSKNMIIIQSAKALNSEIKQKLSKFLKEQFMLSDDVIFKFSLNTKLVCGIAIQAEEHLISWNLATYLDEFQKNMNSEISQLVSKG